MLLIHGTGASTHSWDGLMSALAADTLIAMDLPGMPSPGRRRRVKCPLPGMAELVAALVDELAIDVEVVVGHSAGAAIAAQMVIERMDSPGNDDRGQAFFPLAGWRAWCSPVARLMAATPMAAGCSPGALGIRPPWND